MSRISKVILLLMSLAISSESMACHCAFLPKLSTKDLEEYDYIAWVKVIKVYPVHKPDSGFSQTTDINFKMDIEEVRHFKGEKKNSLVVSGGNYLSEAWTSCDFGMNENQEWVIFGRIKSDKIIVQPCSRTTNYKADDGLRDWQHGRGFKQLAFLDSAFSIDKKHNFPESGSDTLFYENGNPERVLNFIKGERNGTVTYFFPNGKIYGQGSYQKGKLNGDFNWYNHSGKLEEESTYKDGQKVGKSTYFIPIDEDLMQPRMVTIYNKKGQVINFKEYSPGSESWFMSSETLYDPKKEIEEHKYYYEDGKLSSHEILKNGVQIEYREFEDKEDPVLP